MVFANRSEVAAVYLFGSYGTEYQHPNSDIDLGVVFSRTLTFAEELALDAELSLFLSSDKKDWVKSGINYISLMATADYEFEEFLKMSAVARKVMPAEMMLSANIGDFGREEARELKRLG